MNTSGNTTSSQNMHSSVSKIPVAGDEADTGRASSDPPAATSTSTSPAESSTSNNPPQQHIAPVSSSTDAAIDDIDNDAEIVLLTKFRLALGSTLRMLECARDDMVRLGDRMDRLTEASRLCRRRLEEQQKEKAEAEAESKARSER